MLLDQRQCSEIRMSVANCRMFCCSIWHVERSEQREKTICPAVCSRGPTDFKGWNILPNRAQKLLLSALTFLGPSQCGRLEGLTALLTAVTVITRLYLLIPCSTVLLEELGGSQLVKKFPAFCGTRMFTTALTLALHLPLSWARSVQSMLLHPNSWRSVLILSSHLLFGLPSGLFLLGFPTKILYAPLLDM